ncbi:MAG TPA: sugar-binding protein [Bacillales bacterium]|nr:sugar-binding protein [Bacillales bacterium]
MPRGDAHRKRGERFEVKLYRGLYAALAGLLAVSFALTVYFMIRGVQSDAGLAKSSEYVRPHYHFVLIPEEMDNPYWRSVQKGADAAAKKYGAVVEYRGPVQSNLSEHIKVMRESVAAKVDGILTQGLDEREVAVINDAIQHGIPVVTVDTDLPGSRRLAYVGTDNYAAGLKAGRYLAKATGGLAKVGIVTGSFESTGQRLRVKGFRDAVAEIPGIEVVAVESSQISRVQAAEKAYKIFREHPEVNAFFGTSALDGIGISAAAQSLGQSKTVFLLAFDAVEDTLTLMKDGKIDATIVQKPYEMGYESVRLMVEIVNGKPVTERHVTPVNIVLPADLPLSRKAERR